MAGDSGALVRLGRVAEVAGVFVVGAWGRERSNC